MTEIQSIFVSSFIKYHQNFDQSNLYKKKTLTNTRQKAIIWVYLRSRDSPNAEIQSLQFQT